MIAYTSNIVSKILFVLIYLTKIWNSLSKNEQQNHFITKLVITENYYWKQCIIATVALPTDNVLYVLFPDIHLFRVFLTQYMLQLDISPINWFVLWK